MNGIRFTKITATRPKTLTKSFDLGDDGALIKTPGGPLVDGTAETITVPDLEGLAAFIKGLGPADAVSWGVTGYPKARVVTSDALDLAQRNNHPDALPVIARTKKYITWPKGPGVMSLDFDGRKADHADEIFNFLIDLHPAFENAPMIIFPSASSGIYNGETCLRGRNDWRALILVADAQDIPRAGETLFNLTWLKGHGKIFISEAGAQLIRGPLDSCVWSPERLDFISGAYCRPPLEQRRPEPVLYNAAETNLEPIPF